jgi:hypothetical protein
MIAYSDVFSVRKHTNFVPPSQTKSDFHQQIAGFWTLSGWYKISGHLSRQQATKHKSSSLQWLFPKVIWLVVSTPLQNKKVSWDYYSILFPIYGKIQFMFQTTNQNGYFPKSSITPIKSRYQQHARGCQCRGFGFPDEYMEGPPNPSSLWSIQQLNIKQNINVLRCFTGPSVRNLWFLILKYVKHILRHFVTGWWFQPFWKILVSWDYYSQYMET